MGERKSRIKGAGMVILGLCLLMWMLLRVAGILFALLLRVIGMVLVVLILLMCLMMG